MNGSISKNDSFGRDTAYDNFAVFASGINIARKIYFSSAVKNELFKTVDAFTVYLYLIFSEGIYNDTSAYSRMKRPQIVVFGG